MQIRTRAPHVRSLFNRQITYFLFFFLPFFTFHFINFERQRNETYIFLDLVKITPRLPGYWVQNPVVIVRNHPTIHQEVLDRLLLINRVSYVPVSKIEPEA